MTAYLYHLNFLKWSNTIYGILFNFAQFSTNIHNPLVSHDYGKTYSQMQDAHFHLEDDHSVMLNGTLLRGSLLHFSHFFTKNTT